MTLTQRQSVDKIRSRNIRRTSPLEVAPERSSQSATLQLEHTDLIAHVHQLMLQLPERQQMVMHLRDIEEMTYEEIALQLDISLDQVKTYLHRARKTIREQLINHNLRP